MVHTYDKALCLQVKLQDSVPSSLKLGINLVLFLVIMLKTCSSSALEQCYLSQFLELSAPSGFNSSECTENLVGCLILDGQLWHTLHMQPKYLSSDVKTIQQSIQEAFWLYTSLLTSSVSRSTPFYNGGFLHRQPV